MYVLYFVRSLFIPHFHWKRQGNGHKMTLHEALGFIRPIIIIILKILKRKMMIKCTNRPRGNRTCKKDCW